MSLQSAHESTKCMSLQSARVYKVHMSLQSAHESTKCMSLQSAQVYTVHMSLHSAPGLAIKMVKSGIFPVDECLLSW